MGTPGTKTFTSQDLFNATISSVQGNGGLPNTITVTTTTNNGYLPGAVISISGTTLYDEANIVIDTIINGTTFTYVTKDLTNRETTVVTTGSITTRGEAPIPGLPLDDGCRGTHVTGTGRYFAAFSDGVYEIFSDGTPLKRLSLDPSNVSQVSMVGS